MVKIEIEIPDPPEGWVVDGYRKVVAGEMALFDNRQWSKCQYSGTDYSYLVAVKAKPLWEPSPELLAVLRTGWIARDKPGGWYWYTFKPAKSPPMWIGENKSLGAIKRSLLPPDSIPWDKSLFQIGDPQ